MTQEPLENFADPESDPEAKDAERPDWLVGAEEGVEAEFERNKATGPAFELRRPDSQLPESLANRSETERPAGPAPEMRRPDAPTEHLSLPDHLAKRGEAGAAPAAPKPPARWTGASSSVPRLREVTTTRPPASIMAEEAEAEAEREGERERETPQDGFLDAPSGPARTTPRPVRRPPPKPEPFWVVAVDLLMSDARLQVGIGVVVVALLAFIFWPRGGGGGVSISAIRHHPGAYEGQAVRVQGRIGDVFVVGQGYVFNLHQGRDTLVVFTRLRSPRSRERTTVVGSVSMGYLDGAPRVALFETVAP